MKGFFRLFLFCTLSFAFTVSLANAQPKDVTDNFLSANKLYQEGKYGKAIAEYEKALKNGVSGNIYYNIGNCYFKLGMMGKAILYYERAKRFIPRDSDLKSNYDYARSKKDDDSAVIRKRFFLRMLDRMFGGLTIDGLAILLSAIFLMGILLLFISVFNEDTRGFVLVMFAVVSVVFCTGFYVIRDRICGIGHDSVILQKTADAKFEPFDSATTFYQLNEGNIVRVVEKKDGWSKAKRVDGKVGWLKTSSLEAI